MKTMANFNVTSDKLLEALERLQENTNLILAQCRELGVPQDAVNYADLSCVASGVLMIHRRSLVWTVTVAEASPTATEFQLWLAGELHLYGYDAVEVITEW